MLSIKIFVIDGSVFDQNYKKNGECKKVEIIGRKKNTNMTWEERKLEELIIE